MSAAVIPVNVPLPTKIVMQVLEPIDVVAEFGEDPKVDGGRPYPPCYAARTGRACGREDRCSDSGRPIWVMHWTALRPTPTCPPRSLDHLGGLPLMST